MYQDDSNFPGIITLSPAKVDETPVLSIDNITLPNAAAVSGATITPATSKFISSIVVNGVYNDAACSTAADWLSVSYTNNALVYNVEANNGDARTAYVSVKGLNEDGEETDDIVFSIAQPKYVSYANQWVLVTNVTELAVGDKIVIVSTNGTKALGKTQNENNRDAVSVSLDSDDSNIVNITEDVQQLTLGQSNNHWTLYTGTGYLYAASSSANQLRTQTTNNANGEWTIVLNDSNEATIQAQGTSTRNIIKNNGTLFSCYASGQTAVKIFKYYSDGRPAAPISWSDDEGLIEITNSGTEEALPNLNNSNSLAVTFASSDEGVAVIDANGAITAIAAGSTNISATFTSTDSSEYSTTIVSYLLTVTDNRTYTITVNQPSVTGCTISASPSGAQKANTEITLSVTATADGYKFSKWVVKDATNNDVTVTSDKFNMPQSNVVVTAEFVEDSGEIILLSEEFDNSTTSDSSAEISSTKFANFSGDTSKAYTSKFGGIKFGSSSASGYITSKPLDLSSDFTVKINVLKYGSDTGKVQITVGSVTKEITPTDTDTQYSLQFSAATSSSTVKIGTSSKRAYIDNVIIISGN